MDKGLKLGGVALTLALTLAACSDNSTQSGGTITPTAATTTAKEEKPQGSAKLGERFKISNLPGNEVFLTLTDIHVGNTCRHGTLDEGEGLAPGRQILEIAGIVEVEKLDNPNNAGHPVMLNTPYILTEDGFTEEADAFDAIDCQTPKDGSQSWWSQVLVGEKHKVYGKFAIPSNAKEIKIENVKFEIAQIKQKA